jgi:hypothetical protein
MLRLDSPVHPSKWAAYQNDSRVGKSVEIVGEIFEDLKRAEDL